MTEKRTPTGTSTLRLEEREARSVLLVRAVEESDRDGAVLSTHARRTATEHAIAESVGNDPAEAGGGATPAHVDAIAVARARRLSEELVGDHPGLGRLLAPMSAGTVAAVTVGIAFVSGLATSAWGPDRRVSLLAFPVGAILLWNLAAFAAMALGAAARRLAPRRSVGDAAARLGRSYPLGRWLVELTWAAGARRAASSPSAALSAAVGRFRGAWLAAALPLSVARIRFALHLGAMFVAFGAVAGMYAAGIALEYRATWESTWLDAPAVQRYLDLVLGAAARLLGTSVPDVGPLRGPDGAGPAAVWIHLWATTIALFVAVPRLALAGIELGRGARLRRRVPVEIETRALRRALVAARGGFVRVETVFYSCGVPDGAHDRLSSLLLELLGARARSGDTLHVDYGAAADDVPLPGDEGSHRLVVVVVFPAAQTPEIEVHGEFLERLIERTRAADHELVALIETSTYLDRVGSDERVHERCATWGRLFRAVHMNPASDLDDATDSGFLAWVSPADSASETEP